VKLTDKAGYDEHHFRSFFKVKTVRDRKRLDFCAKLPCAGCGAPPPNDPHHEAESRGMGIKGNDNESLPLCRRCHAWRHQVGRSVYELWKIDVKALIARINKCYEMSKSR
jgi:hypothetical protein